MRQQPKIVFKPGTVDRLVVEHDTTISGLAIEIGVNYTQLYRSTLDTKNKNFNFVGPRIIAGVLNAFPGSKFEDHFDVILV